MFWSFFWGFIAIVEAVVIYILISSGAVDRAKADQAVKDTATAAEQGAESLAAKIKRLVTKELSK